jgi:7-cyano-7-deazaguanine reductase
MSAATHDLPLGKDSRFVTTYTPSLLRGIARAEARAPMGLSGALPFRGEDAWNCYEFSWLDGRGKPEVAMLRVQVPCTSSHMVESKSLKLYLNSFAQTRFVSRRELVATLDSDLAVAFRAPVIVAMLDVEHGAERILQHVQLPGRCIDGLDVACDVYEREPSMLACEDTQALTRETLHSHVFRSLCPITGQPDWASVLVQYVGRPIVADSLLRYLVSYRQHAAFHESTIEQIFVDLLERCGPEQLTVYGRFLRRGGIDINPFRSTHESVAPDYRLARQ